MSDQAGDVKLSLKDQIQFLEDQLRARRRDLAEKERLFQMQSERQWLRCWCVC